MHTGVEITAVHGNGHIDAADVRHADGRTSTIDCNAIFVFIGAEPRTDWLEGVVERDERGYVLTGRDLWGADGPLPGGWPLERPPLSLETSLPGVFVAGDVRADSVKRVASAVGEGAMAVTLVHRYLEER